MARISGVDLPREKRVEIGLTYIFGIGLTTAQRICRDTGINPERPVLTPFVPIKDSPQMSFWERNPYYYGVDPEGNQLPYIDKLQMDRAADLSILDAKIVSLSVAKLLAGSIDVGEYIQSTGYVAGTTGWRIHGDGSAERQGCRATGLLLGCEADHDRAGGGEHPQERHLCRNGLLQLLQ